MTTEESLARIESQLYFQERLLSQLNDALTAQQRQIDRLEAQCARLEKLLEEAVKATRDAPANTLPPHFMPERY